MKKISITVSYDEETLNTLKIYLDEKGTSVEDEILKHLDALYARYVPASVRDFFVRRSGGVVSKPTPKLKKPKTPDVSTDESGGA